MKKLILSAFAMSLTLISLNAFSQAESVDDFLGLEMEILPDLKGPQKFTPSGLHKEGPEWNVKVEQVELDKEPLKGQGYSMIPWTEQDPESWLSIDDWLTERDIKDRTPDWKMRLRDNSQTELAGKILQCKGKCFIFRGEKPVSVTHLSQVMEGDEIKTDKDSLAWIYLMDGTLVRLGPETSLTMQGMDIHPNVVFFHGRLNQGHLFWLPRRRGPMEFNSDPETDSMSLPLMVRDANLEFYERKTYQANSDKEYTSSILEVNNLSISQQINSLNELWTKNSAEKLPFVQLLITTPNASFMTYDATFDLVYVPGSESYFKQRPPTPLGRSEFQPRGYLATAYSAVENDKWHKVSTNGRAIDKIDEPDANLQILELLTKRVTTIELARELWLAKYTLPVMYHLGDFKKLAIEYGYKIWGDDIFRRIEFLKEYSRRIETTHLKSVENLMTRLEANGQTIPKSPSDAAYKASLNHYLLGLKNRYSNKKMQVREMNDVQYYVWILKNGKL